MKVSKATQMAVQGIIDEVIAGCVLTPKDDLDESWNSANRRTRDIAAKYLKGDGLFQNKRCGA